MIEILWLNCLKKLNLIIKISGCFFDPNYSWALPESLSEPIRIISNESESIRGPLIFNTYFSFESTLQWGKDAIESKACI